LYQGTKQSGSPVARTFAAGWLSRKTETVAKHKVQFADVAICRLQGAILIDIIAARHAFLRHATQGPLMYGA